MGKVMATELQDVRVDFVSFVEEGANGKRFSIFKSADYKPEDNDVNDFSKEDKGILKRIVEHFKKHVKSEKEDEQIMKELAEKILIALGAMQKSLEALAGGFEKLEKSLIKEEGGEGGEAEQGKASDASGGDAGEGNAGNASSGDGTEPPAGGAADAGQAADAVTKAIEAMTKTIEGLAKRVEDVEKRRNPSNAITKDPGADADVSKGVPKDFWKGTF